MTKITKTGLLASATSSELLQKEILRYFYAQGEGRTVTFIERQDGRRKYYAVVTSWNGELKNYYVERKGITRPRWQFRRNLGN